MSVRERLARVRMLALDVDGVLTDGRLYYGHEGQVLTAFHVRDGLGLRSLREAGIAVAVVSGRRSPGIEQRMVDLGIEHVVTGRDDKWPALAELLERLAIVPAEAAFVGDDVLDLPPMRAVGTAIAVADAHPAVRAEAHWVTTLSGGCGAAREIADAILEART